VPVTAEKNSSAAGGRAGIDFQCLNKDCRSGVKLSLAEIGDPEFQAVCPRCKATYELDDTLRDRLLRMLDLVQTIRRCEDILGDASVAVATADDEVRVPYALLLTRLNTMISLEMGGEKVNFHLWIEPASPETFR